jgi:GTP-binding protein
MKPFAFINPKFLKSALKMQDYPRIAHSTGQEKPEIALIGKSNVGKSSLINYLFNHSKLAKVSSTPGKTQTLNFFSVDDSLTLVDLPGYGYSEVARTLKSQWADCIEQYLHNRKALLGVVQLIDIRRMPSEQDLAFIRWCDHYKKPYFLLFTKADKIGLAERKNNIDASLKLIRESTGVEPTGFAECSVKEGKGRSVLIHQINTFLRSLWA